MHSAKITRGVWIEERVSTAFLPYTSESGVKIIAPSARPINYRLPISPILKAGSQTKLRSVIQFCREVPAFQSI